MLLVSLMDSCGGATEPCGGATEPGSGRGKHSSEERWIGQREGG